MRLIAALLLVLSSAHAAPQYSAELIFPLEKWHNHSSSIVELPNGDLLVCWFHGSGERTADDVLIQAARWNHATRNWTAPFTLADTPGFPETNPVLFLDSHQRLFFLWPLIVAHQWETALMKYRISTDYQQPSGPPKWEFQDNIVLIPKDIVPLTRDFASAAAAETGPRAERAKKLIEKAQDEYFSRMGWFTRTHPLELPSGRILVPMYSDGYSYGIMAISDDHGYTWNASQPIVGEGLHSTFRRPQERRHARGLPPRQRTAAQARAHQLLQRRRRHLDARPRYRHSQPRHQSRKHAPAQRQLDHGL